MKNKFYRYLCIISGSIAAFGSISFTYTATKPKKSTFTMRMHPTVLCPTCHQAFSNEKLLERHIKKHDPSYESPLVKRSRKEAPVHLEKSTPLLPTSTSPSLSSSLFLPISDPSSTTTSSIPLYTDEELLQILTLLNQSENVVTQNNQPPHSLPSDDQGMSLDEVFALLDDPLTDKEETTLDPLLPEKDQEFSFPSLEDETNSSAFFVPPAATNEQVLSHPISSQNPSPSSIGATSSSKKRPFNKHQLQWNRWIQTTPPSSLPVQQEGISLEQAFVLLDTPVVDEKKTNNDHFLAEQNSTSLPSTYDPEMSLDEVFALLPELAE